ncbi:hypothetical protein T492DRAFT_917909 [Pavlovales sp. CCMP2436]|nr:hypothetical protein T492DRAFT_917909 [Pavlovales sp. CCMP2436]
MARLNILGLCAVLAALAAPTTAKLTAAESAAAEPAAAEPTPAIIASPSPTAAEPAAAESAAAEPTATESTLAITAAADAYSVYEGQIVLDWDPAEGGNGKISYCLHYEEGFVVFARVDLVGPPQATYNSTTFSVKLYELARGANYSLLIVAVAGGEVSANRETVHVRVSVIDPTTRENVTLIVITPSETLSFTRISPIDDLNQIERSYFQSPLLEDTVMWFQILAIDVTMSFFFSGCVNI